MITGSELPAPAIQDAPIQARIPSLSVGEGRRRVQFGGFNHLLYKNFVSFFQPTKTMPLFDPGAVIFGVMLFINQSDKIEKRYQIPNRVCHK